LHLFGIHDDLAGNVAFVLVIEASDHLPERTRPKDTKDLESVREVVAGASMDERKLVNLRAGAARVCEASLGEEQWGSSGGGPHLELARPNRRPLNFQASNGPTLSKNGSNVQNRRVGTSHGHCDRFRLYGARMIGCFPI
jgi:hypothetical protein